MTREKIEDVSTEKLLKRKKFWFVILAIYLGLILAYIAFFIYDLADGGQLDKSLYSGLIAIVGTIWLPIVGLKAIKDELKRRDDNHMTEKPQS